MSQVQFTVDGSHKGVLLLENGVGNSTWLGYKENHEGERLRHAVDILPTNSLPKEIGVYREIRKAKYTWPQMRP